MRAFRSCQMASIHFRLKLVLCCCIALGVVLSVSPAFAQTHSVSSAFAIARLKYAGGGDWYNDPSAEVNLLTFVHEQTGMTVDARYHFVELSNDGLFSCPFVFLTGHGNIAFSEPEGKRLRKYLENGGFLYADDDYGMDKPFRRELKKVLPEEDLVELPFSHGIYHVPFEFAAGPPKIHEHDGKPAQGFGVFINGRMAVYYTYETNPSDGWADAEVHNDPEAKRREALQFGANIVIWALTH